ncbi:hypothetical protein [Streptomyces sp. SID10853]|nr:hypothetical protein [Streptomyces sp. SID10853]
MTIGPRGSEQLIGVFFGSGRAEFAGAGEVSQQLKWIHSGIDRH